MAFDKVRVFCFWAIIVCIVTMSLLRPQNHVHYSQTLLRYNMLEKETVLHFFLHDTPGGNKPSAVKVVQPNNNKAKDDTSTSPSGTVWVVDDPLTEGPEPTSKVIGDSKGVYVSAGKKEIMLVAYLDFGFTSGEFNGSSISMVSRNPVTEVEREFAVVGGRGKFRMARGFAKLNCVFYNHTTGDSIGEYTVVLRPF